MHFLETAYSPYRENKVPGQVNGSVFFAFHSVEMVTVLGQVMVHVLTSSCWYCSPHLPIFLSIGAPQAITEILKLRVALARGVTAAQGAPFTVTVTVGLGSVSAGQALLGSDVRNVSRGTFWWKAIVFVGIFLQMFKDGFSFKYFPAMVLYVIYRIKAYLF